MKTITFNISGPETYELIIPDDYQKKELPYFKEWTEALDSGSYSQTSGQLCETISYPESTQTCYCCLGVLSKIQGRLTANNTDGLLVNLGTNNDVAVTGSVTANAGTNLNTSALALESGNLAAAVTALQAIQTAVESGSLPTGAATEATLATRLSLT